MKMKFYFFQFLRFIFLGIKYKKSFLAFIILKFSRTLFFEVRIERSIKKIEENKQAKRIKKISLGHAEIGKKINLFFYKRLILSIFLKEGTELTAEHFYFSRNTNEVSRPLDLFFQFTSNQFPIKKNMRVFEPGCGCGKMLYYIVDKFDVHGFGADIYKPSFKIASDADIFKEMTFKLIDCYKSNFLETYDDNFFDFTFCSSYLGHLTHLEDFNLYLDRLLRVSKITIVFERNNSTLSKYLSNKNFIFIPNNNFLLAFHKG
jgi:hypothetical protein